MKTSLPQSEPIINNQTVLQIAIDGPVGAGKSDISDRLAKELGITYLYTGAMYRAAAWLCRKYNVPFKDEKGATELLNTHVIELTTGTPKSGRSYAVLVDNTDVTDQLFTPDIDQPTSDVSTLPEVRKFLVKRQQELAQGKSVVMEGRDIGKRVLPNAQLKIYLTADVTERANRRYEQWVKKGITNKTIADAQKETTDRDYQDMHRPYDPLEKLSDAWELDTTGMTQEEVIDTIKQELNKKWLLKKS
jgi:CMP/dCMP kinase